MHLLNGCFSLVLYIFVCINEPTVNVSIINSVHLYSAQLHKLSPSHVTEYCLLVCSAMWCDVV